jgi:hypothetical protein
MLCGIQVLLPISLGTLNQSKKELVELFWVVLMILTVVPWTPAKSTLCLEGGRNIVLGSLKGCLKMTGPNLLSRLPDMKVMVDPCAILVKSLSFV